MRLQNVAKALLIAVLIADWIAEVVLLSWRLIHIVDIHRRHTTRTYVVFRPLPLITAAIRHALLLMPIIWCTQVWLSRSQHSPAPSLVPYTDDSDDFSVEILIPFRGFVMI